MIIINLHPNNTSSIDLASRHPCRESSRQVIVQWIATRQSLQKEAVGWFVASASIPVSIGYTMTATAPAIPIITEICVGPFSGLVVVGMTSSTTVGIGRRWPVYSLTVVMTLVTSEVATMITRVVARYMAVVGRRSPAACGMAVIALPGGHEVTLVFAFGRGAVMAGVAGAVYSGVIKIHAAPCGGGVMTIIALGRGLDMIRRHTGGEVAIVAI